MFLNKITDGKVKNIQIKHKINLEKSVKAMKWIEKIINVIEAKENIVLEMLGV